MWSVGAGISGSFRTPQTQVSGSSELPAAGFPAGAGAGFGPDAAVSVHCAEFSSDIPAASEFMKLLVSITRSIRTWSLAFAVIALFASAYATPVGVTPLDEQAAHRELTANVRSAIIATATSLLSSFVQTLQLKMMLTLPAISL